MDLGVFLEIILEAGREERIGIFEHED